MMGNAACSGSPNPLRAVGLPLAPLMMVILLGGACLSPAAQEAPDHLVVAQDRAYPPFIFPDGSGRPRGIFIDIWDLWSAKSGVQVEYRLQDWDATLESVRSGQAHVVGCLFRTPEREAEFDFIGPILDIPLHIFFHHQIAGVKGLEDLTGFRVGVIGDGNIDELLRSRYPDVDRALYGSGDDVVQAALDGHIKVFVIDSPIAQFYLAQREGGDQFRQSATSVAIEPAYVAVRKGDAGLLATIASGFDQISDQEIAAIVAQWEGRYSSRQIPWRGLAYAFAGLATLAAGFFIWNLQLRRRVATATCNLADQNLQLAQSRENARRSEERFLVTLESIGDAVITTDDHSVVTLINAVAQELTGWSAEEAVGRPLSDVFYIRSAQTGQRLASPTEQVLALGRQVSRADPSILVSRDGREYHITDSAAPIRNLEGEIIGVVMVFRDETERLLDQDSLRQSEGLIRALLDQTYQFLGLLDTEGRILKVNRRALDFAGATLEQTLGQPFTEAPWWPDPDEAARICDEAFAMARSGKTFRREVEQVNARNAIRMVDLSISPFLDPSGAVLYLIAEGRDITENKRVQDAIAENERRFRAIFDNAPYSIVIHRLDNGVFLDANRAFLNRIGMTRPQIQGCRVDELFPAAAEDAQAIMETLLRDGAVQNQQATLWSSDGTADIIYSSVLLDQETQPKALSMAVDVTEWKRTEQALRESEERYRAIFNNAPIGIFRTTFAGRFLDANPTLARMLGFDTREQMLASVHDLATDIYPNPAERQRLLDMLMATPAGVQTEIEFKRRDGTPFHSVINASLQMDANGAPAFLDGTIEDITERKRAETRRLEAERKLSTLMGNLPGMAYRCLPDENWTMAFISEGCKDLTGYDPEALIGNARLAYAELIHPEDRPAVQDAVHQCIQSQRPFAVEYRLRDAGGQEKWVWEKGMVVASDALEGFILDITERKRAEEHLERLKTAIEQSDEIILITDPQGRIEYVNAAFERITGYQRDEALGRDPSILKSGAHEPAFYADLWQTISSGETWKGRLINRRKDGSRYTEDATISPVTDDSGRIVNYVAAKHDITSALALEAQYRQAQKMEAIGQLTGGVAHDFNNLLQVINGYTDMALNDLALHDADAQLPCHHYLDEVRKAGKRAAQLVKQLLLFSRRQVMQPKLLNLNAVVADMLKMLGRVIGEDIRLEWTPCEAPVIINADSGMIDQALMNLCVNARDAMPDGGVLTIETRPVRISAEFCQRHTWAKPGRFVLLAVTDTGHGMDRETLDRIFEPFFTTKAEGKGTGLGLATVYGIVRQHSGMVDVYSEPDHGTTFKVYLPLHENLLDQEAPEDETPPAGGTEMILVAEDDAMVRALAIRILEQAGYTVLAAVDGEEAVAMFQRNADRVALLILDVVMPRLGGHGAFEQIRAIAPDIPVLFASGYSESAIHTNFVLKEGLRLIQKPYTSADLLRAIRETLDKEEKEQDEKNDQG